MAATYIWDNGEGTILEADILYNTSQSWAVNASIDEANDPTICGTDFDVEAIGVHEIGHLLGLGHVDNPAATMFGSAAKGELMKQTLTPGDALGGNEVVP